LSKPFNLLSFSVSCSSVFAQSYTIKASMFTVQRRGSRLRLCLTNYMLPLLFMLKPGKSIRFTFSEGKMNLTPPRMLPWNIQNHSLMYLTELQNCSFANYHKVRCNCSYVKYNTKESSGIKVYMYNTNGVLVYQADCQGSEYRMYTTDLSNGLYVLKFCG